MSGPVERAARARVAAAHLRVKCDELSEALSEARDVGVRGTVAFELTGRREARAEVAEVIGVTTRGLRVVTEEEL